MSEQQQDHTFWRVFLRSVPKLYGNGTESWITCLINKPADFLSHSLQWTEFLDTRWRWHLGTGWRARPPGQWCTPPWSPADISPRVSASAGGDTPPWEAPGTPPLAPGLTPSHKHSSDSADQKDNNQWQNEMMFIIFYLAVVWSCNCNSWIFILAVAFVFKLALPLCGHLLHHVIFFLLRNSINKFTFTWYLVLQSFSYVVSHVFSKVVT